jgi:hypothetical protein
MLGSRFWDLGRDLLAVNEIAMIELSLFFLVLDPEFNYINTYK